MELDRSYILPIIYSIGLHALILLLLLLHFQNNYDILKPQLRVVASVSVQSSDLKKIDQQIKNQKKVDQKKPKPEEKPQPKPPEPDAIAIEKQKEKEKLEEQKKKEEEQKKKEEQKKQEELKKKEAEKKQKLKQQKDLLSEALSETPVKAKVTAPPTDLTPNAPDSPTDGVLDGDEDLAKIVSKVKSNWSIPASYQKGMTVLLVVDLMPTGEVVDVKIAESSGDTGFDRSAEAAVRKSSPLPVPQDPRRFDAVFRKFNLLFDPKEML